jgi:nitrogen-specific signal transduction histidine kinase
LNPDGPAALVRPLGHEVGNLLAGIRLAASLLEREALGENVEIARDQGRLAGQAGALLAQLRLLVAPEDAERARVGTAALLDAVSSAVVGCEPAGATLRIARGRGLPDVRVDPDATHHVIVGLLLGALEAAGPGGRVSLRARVAGRRVVLEIRDDGRSIESAARGHPPRGRALPVGVAHAVLRSFGGSAKSLPVRRGAHVALSLPTATPRNA